MEKTLENLVQQTFYQPLPKDWLICDDSDLFAQLSEQLYLELTQFSYYRGTPLKILLAEREPVRFLAGFLAACAARCPVFLCNPDWGKQEWQQVFDLVKPDLIWGLGTKNWGQDNSKFKICPADTLREQNSKRRNKRALKHPAC